MSAGITLVMLPGMDGTGRLFAPFIKELPEGFQPVVVSYPPDRPLGYRELEPIATAAFPGSGPFAILGESFSGPLANARCIACSASLAAARMRFLSFVTPIIPTASRCV